MDTSGAAVGVAPPVPPPTFQVSQVRGPEAFLSSTAPAQVREWAPRLGHVSPTGTCHAVNREFSYSLNLFSCVCVCVRIQLLTKRHLEELLQEVDPHQLLDEDVAEVRAQDYYL